jgi:hypothetical protein
MRVGEVAQFYEKSGPATFDKAGLIEREKGVDRALCQLLDLKKQRSVPT